MAYNPQVQSRAGEFYMQGMEGLGQGIAEGLRAYAHNRKEEAAITGLIEAFGPQKLQALAPSMSEKGQKLVEKFLTGKANLADKTTLAGTLQATQKIVETEQQAKLREMQMKEAEQAAKMNALKIQEAQSVAAARQRLAAPPAPPPGAPGVPGLLQQVQPGGMQNLMQRMGPASPQPRQAADPLEAFSRQIVANTGSAPSQEVLQRFMETRAKDVGTVMTMQQVQELRKQGMDADALPLPDGRFMVRKTSLFAPAASTTVNMPGEDEYAKTVGRAAGERQMKEYAAAEEATQSIPKIDQTLDLLRKGDPTTGALAELRNNVNRLASQFAGSEKAGKKVTDTQVLDALLGSDVFPMIGALGIGARGLDTPAEREFLRQVMTGTIALDKNALVRLTETRRAIQERAITAYNKKVEAGEMDRFFDKSGLKKRTFEVPAMRTTADLLDAADAIIKRKP